MSDAPLPRPADASDSAPEWARYRGIVGTTRALASLEPALRDEMFALMDAHFRAQERAVFDADLAEKDAAILLHDASGALKGFSTWGVRQETVDGRPIGVFFSGDTIVAPEAWGSPVLARCWLRAVLDAAAQVEGPLYWLFICSGFRTYRFLCVYWRSFIPRVGTEAEAADQRLLDALARGRFGERYRGGIVHLPGGALREGIGTIDDRRRRNRDVAFFERRNPGHHQGDELACLCRLDVDNLSPAGERILRAIGGA